MFNPNLSIGQEIDNSTLTPIFRCGNMGGMRRSNETNTLVLVADYTKGLYHDKWIGGTLHYTGMGKIGDQDILKPQNSTLADSATNGVDVHLFEVMENTGNTPLYLHDGQFDIEDNDGHLLTTENMISTCPDAIFPGEIGYFYDDYIDLSDVDSSNGLKFVPHYKVEEARHEIIDYEVSDIGIREDNMFKCKVSGRLTNTSEDEINLLYINVIYYDGNGNVIGISGTNVMDIQPGDTTSFEITGSFFSDNVGYADIAEYRVIPRAWYMQF